MPGQPWRLRLAACALFGVAAVGVWRVLPSPLFSVPYAVVLLDRNGALLGARIAQDGQWRFPPMETIPDRYAQALVTQEDRRFFIHPGIDPLAVVRALRTNLSAGRVVSGASTLSMQVIRLARGNPARAVGEKFVEALLALRLELGYSKREILSFYAAHAPFGGNVVGVEAASWRYFGRPPQHVTWAEAATLAVLPNSPGLIHPGRGRGQLQEKRDRLLRRLHAAGAMDAEELALSLRESLPVAPRPLPRFAPHLLDTLAKTHASPRLASTLDRGVQLQVNDIVAVHAQALERLHIGNAAAVVIDNRRFEVLAYVGNACVQGPAERACEVDIVRRPRSTGSILKPILYAALLDAGRITPTMLVPDIPTQVRGYMPENYDKRFRGAVPVREALAQSLNVPAVRLLHEYGVERFFAQLRSLGLTTLFRPAQDYGLTLAVGGAEITLWDAAAMYANLAARVDDHRVDRWRAPSVIAGPATAENGAPRPADISRGAAFLTLDALREVVRPGDDGHWEKFSSTFPIAWKTGTSYGLRDGWAVGVTPAYTVAVWTGNADGEGVAGLTGSTAAAPLMLAIFSALPQGGWFAVPEVALRTVQVCADDGYLATAECETTAAHIPAGAHFDRPSPFHRRVHLDAERGYRVHGDCEAITRMRSENWFVLPTGIEFYYRRVRADYRRLPPWRSDCRSTLAADEPVIDLLYPAAGAGVYIPVDLDGRPSALVVEAVHRERDMKIYWYLDEQYLGETVTFHNFAVNAPAGSHVLTLVDVHGNRVTRRFAVLARE